MLAFIDSAGHSAARPPWTLLVIGVAAKSANAPRHAISRHSWPCWDPLIGNVALFMAARHGGSWFSKGEPKPGQAPRFQEWFQRYGLLTVFIPAVTPVIPLPLKVFVISAGALRTPFGRFLSIVCWRA